MLTYTVDLAAGPARFEARVVASDEQTAVLVIRNITAQTQTEQRLQRREEVLEAVLSSVPLVVYATDLNGIFTLSEGQGLSGLGLAPGQVIGQSALAMYSAAPTIVASIRRALAGETFTNTTNVGRVFQSTYTPIRREGAIIGMLGVSVDITAEITTQHEVERLQRYNELLINAVSEGVLGLDQVGQVTFLNAAALRMVGWEAASLIGTEHQLALQHTRPDGTFYPFAEVADQHDAPRWRDSPR